MAKFRFNLEKVLAHRKVLETLAQSDLQQGLAVLSAATDELVALEKARHEAFVRRFENQVQGGQAERLKQVHDYLAGQDLRIDKQRKKIQGIEKQVELLQEALRLKAMDTKIIESLKDRKQEEFRIEERKREQKTLDDLTSTRFLGREQSDEDGI